MPNQYTSLFQKLNENRGDQGDQMLDKFVDENSFCRNEGDVLIISVNEKDWGQRGEMKEGSAIMKRRIMSEGCLRRCHMYEKCLIGLRLICLLSRADPVYALT